MKHSQIGFPDGDRATNLQAAISGFRRALEVFRAEALPNDHLRTSRLLGAALLAVGDWVAAAEALDAARSTADLLIGQGLNAAETVRVLEETSAIGPQAAFAWGKMGDPLRALKELEAGRARQLAVALRLNTARDALDAADREQFDKLRTDLRAADAALEAAPEEQRQKRLDALILVRREFASFVERGQAARVAAEPSLEDRISALTSTGASLVAPVFTDAGALLFVVRPGAATSQIDVVDLIGVSGNTLSTQLRGSDGWFAAYGSDEKRSIAIEQIGEQLWCFFASSLVKTLDANGVMPGARVVVLPQSVLGLLPLGLARDPQTGKLLFELYELSLTPSVAALNAGHRTARTPSLAAIVNPTGDLPFTPIEAALVDELFLPDMRVAVHRDAVTASAVLDALKAKSHWLFSCHGAFNWSDPRQSGLALARGEALTLDSFLSAQGLGGPRLVALSACETGLHDINRAPEEFIGLPAAFLQIGAACVLATLWPVNDVSTALLVSRFFRHHIADHMEPSAALKAAQIWLRDLTVRDLRMYVQDVLQSGLPDTVAPLLTKFLRDLVSADPAALPFRHPLHWGGFAIYGS